MDVQRWRFFLLTVLLIFIAGQAYDFATNAPARNDFIAVATKYATLRYAHARTNL